MESKPIPIKQIAKDLSISSTTVSRHSLVKGECQRIPEIKL